MRAEIESWNLASDSKATQAISIDDQGRVTFLPPRDAMELSALRDINRIGIELDAVAATWAPPRGVDKPDTDKRIAGAEAWIHLVDGGV